MYVPREEVYYGSTRAVSPEAGRVDSQEALIEKLSISVVENAAHSQHLATFTFRRRLIPVQLLLIVSGVVLLFCALICRLLVP
jgi:hypothetical protein